MYALRGFYVRFIFNMFILLFNASAISPVMHRHMNFIFIPDFMGLLMQ